jgi:hypothetical protein
MDGEKGITICIIASAAQTKLLGLRLAFNRYRALAESDRQILRPARGDY